MSTDANFVPDKVNFITVLADEKVNIVQIPVKILVDRDLLLHYNKIIVAVCATKPDFQ